MRRDAGSDGRNARSCARTLEPDRYLAALLSPRAARDDLIALAAFVAELEAHSPDRERSASGRNPPAWWRDALLAGDGAQRAIRWPTPCAPSIARHALDREALAAWLDALVHTFYPRRLTTRLTSIWN